MMKGMVFVKRLTMVFTLVAVIAVASLNGMLKVEAAKTQMMEINCPHCHENTTVDVMQDDVECTNCFVNIHIDG